MTIQYSKRVYLILGALLLVFVVFFLDSRVAGNGKRVLLAGGVQIEVEIADNPVEQTRGLSGRGELCRDCGMLFIFKNAGMRTFWMKDMKFPLDIIYIQDHKITEIYENIQAPTSRDPQPRQVSSQRPADMVLEVNAGFAKDNELKIGDSLDKL